jgi:hydrogenase maturation protein HypF
VNGQAFVSQHIGDLDDGAAREAFEQTARDLLAMYDLAPEDVCVAHDAHPSFASTRFAAEMGASRLAVQHHRAHVASVLAEHAAWERPVVGVAFDGTGYGDDGSIWGGELFVGSVADGFERAAHLHPAVLPGGDAAATWPVQAAAGFLADLDLDADLTAPPFSLPERFEHALRLIDADVRVFPTTSVGRLFDVAAALLGFTGAVAYEGQAAIELEQQARPHATNADATNTETPGAAYPFPDLDVRPLLRALIRDRAAGRPVGAVARAFHRGLARGLADTLRQTCAERGLDTVVLSGGVFQNQLLLRDLRDALSESGLTVWTNRRVPPNDGGISLGQAALAAFR